MGIGVFDGDGLRGRERVPMMDFFMGIGVFEEVDFVNFRKV